MMDMRDVRWKRQHDLNGMPTSVFTKCLGGMAHGPEQKQSANNIFTGIALAAT